MWDPHTLYFSLLFNDFIFFFSRTMADIWTETCGFYTKTTVLDQIFNPLTPNDLYMSRTAPLTSKRCILYIYSTNIGTEYFKHALYSPFFSLQNAVCFIMLTSLVPVLFTFYIQGVLKLKKNNSGAKGLISFSTASYLSVAAIFSEKSTIFFLQLARYYNQML